MNEANAQPAMDPGVPLPPMADAILTRPPDTSINRMTFWDSRFTPARAKFIFTITAPEKRSESGFDIRVESNWDGVYKKLQLARAQYMANTGFGGFLKGARRQVADHWTEPIKGIIKFVPDIDYVTPVLGAVEIVLDAMKASADARQESLTAFDNLQSTFSTVELLFVLWPHDDALKGASIKLIVATMAAIEVAIGFFIQPGWKKSKDAILKGGNYGDTLRTGLAEIKTCTDVLLQEAEFSQMIDTRNARIEAKKYFAKLDEYQNLLKEIQGEVSNTAKSVNEMHGKVSNGAKTLNSLKESLEDFIDRYEHDQEKERVREAKREEEERKREKERQKEERQMQEERRRQQAELDAANSKIHQLEIERAASRAPSPYQLPPFSPPPPPPKPQPIIYPYFSPEALWRLLDMPALEAADLSHIVQKRLRVPSLDRARTELLPGRNKFAGWISALKSTRLLIHGDFGPQPVSALSVFCAVLVRALEGRRRIIRLVWFCGRHIDARDRRSAGGVAMLRSFIAQLLCQQWVDTRWMLRDIGFDPVPVRAGDMDQLLMLFGWLVRQLPRDVTVFCIVDGVCFYERAEFLDGMSDVVACAARLSMDKNINSTIKLLVTSPTATKVVRNAFEDDDLILSMKGMTDLGLGTSFSGLKRAAASESEDDTSSEESEESPYNSSDEESEDESRTGVLSDGSEDSASDDDSTSNTDTGSEDTTDSDGDSESDQYS